MIDKLIQLVRGGFQKVTDSRSTNTSYKLCDILSIGFAMFSLKDPSLTFFREQYPVREENLRRIYGIESLPGDTALRESLDEVKPSELQDLFKIPIGLLNEEKVFEKRRVLGKYTAVSVDGTGHYCSGKKSCPGCMIKNHRNGTQTFYHQLLGAVAVHPKQSTVFPIACEAIVKQDGSTKNDCELNASKRLIPQIRKMLPDKEIITIFDALYINGPHIKALSNENMRYIIGTKGQTYVDIQVERLRKNNELQSLQWKVNNKICTVHFANGLMLNGQHPEILTNYFEYSEIEKSSGKQVFFSTWITDIEITLENVQDLVDVARAMCKIENETFNTLKNQGYHFGHNYGHGKKHLATNFAILTFLAFLTDQIAQHLDKAFQAARAVCKSFKSFWERVRNIFYLLPALSMNAIYRFIVKQKQVNIPALE
jgi:hypothetical protein